MMKHYKSAFILIFSFIKIVLAGDPSQLKILAYNVYNFRALTKTQIKSKESRQTVIAIISKANPDIMVLSEVGKTAAAKEIQAELKKLNRNYPYLSVVNGVDRYSSIVILSKIKPAAIKHQTDLSYTLKKKKVFVLRGFAYCIFKFTNGYTLHLVGVHLKSKVYNKLGQTDMRRYEARQLHYLVQGIQKNDPNANILIVGDFNDSPNSSPLNSLFSRRSSDIRQLYDLRPVDKFQQSWTHCWDEEDLYSRIDYALSSHALLPELQYERCFIPSISDWSVASDHRPIFVTINLKDKKPSSETLVPFYKNIRKPTPVLSNLHKGRVIGTRKARKSQ